VSYLNVERDCWFGFVLYMFQMLDAKNEKEKVRMKK